MLYCLDVMTYSYVSNVTPLLSFMFWWLDVRTYYNVRGKDLKILGVSHHCKVSCCGV